MIDFNQIEDWGDWGVDSFYKGHDTLLKTAILLNRPFDTDWHGFKHEPIMLRVTRHSDEQIQVAVTNAVNIRNKPAYPNPTEAFELTQTLSPDSSYYDVINVAKKLSEQCRFKIHKTLLAENKSN